MKETMQDRVKRHYQRMLGGGHMVQDAAASLARLEAECASMPEGSAEEPLFESLGGGMSRLNLRPAVRRGLSPALMNAMFVYSANHFVGDREAFEAGLDVLAQTEADRQWLAAYRAEGCPAVGHSEAYRAAHHPAYRVVMDVFDRAFAMIEHMCGMKEGLVAVEGPCGAGKSTVAEAVGAVLGANVLHVDDFFLRPEQRTPERLAEPGGNFDREHFYAEAIVPLREGKDFTFRPYNCAHQVLAAPVPFVRTPLVIVEGVYGMHPDVAAAYDYRVFVDVDSETQRNRIARRNGEAMLRRFETEWIPMEERYFAAFGIKAQCDLVVRGV